MAAPNLDDIYRFYQGDRDAAGRIGKGFEARRREGEARPQNQKPSSTSTPLPTHSRPRRQPFKDMKEYEKYLFWRQAMRRGQNFQEREPEPEPPRPGPQPSKYIKSRSGEGFLINPKWVEWKEKSAAWIRWDNAWGPLREMPPTMYEASSDEARFRSFK